MKADWISDGSSRAVIISVAYFLYLYITSEPSLFSSFSLYILVCIVVVFANALIKFLRLKRWINKHSNYAILAFDTPTSWIKSIRCLHIGKLDCMKDSKGKAFFYDKSTLVVPGKHEFCFDIQKRSGKTIVHLYSVYMDFNVAPSMMYVLKENEDGRVPSTTLFCFDFDADSASYELLFCGLSFQPV